MATIQDGDLIYIRSVLGPAYEFLAGDTEAGELTLVDVPGDSTTRWRARSVSTGGWAFECQGDNGLLRFLDSDAGTNVNLDDDPTDASTHWDLIQTTTSGRWQIKSRSYEHFLNGDAPSPVAVSNGSLDRAHWELLLIAL